MAINFLFRAIFLQDHFTGYKLLGKLFLIFLWICFFFVWMAKVERLPPTTGGLLWFSTYIVLVSHFSWELELAGSDDLVGGFFSLAFLDVDSIS